VKDPRFFELPGLDPGVLGSTVMIVYLAHATSFCGAVWNPVTEAMPGIETVTWDFAGHGAGPAMATPVDWAVFGEQVLDETEPGGIGVGHSMGGTALVMAQLEDPERFKALILIEPIIFPGPHSRVEHQLADIAAKRKDRFGSREEALENFATRRAFASWHPDALAGYVDCGLTDDFRLACDPAVEADIYRASNDHDTFERMVDVEIPVLIIAGESSEMLGSDLVRAQAGQFHRAGFELVEGAGHFLPMERPDLVAERTLRLATSPI
jgi:pimeloyl-ACP methyl ester carboxylesterase